MPKVVDFQPCDRWTWQAYRDAISADLVLQHAVMSKVEQLPSCKALFEAKMARWTVERNRGCKRNSDKAYGGASLEPMAMSLCMAHEAEQMTKQVERQRACKR
ncbi:MAG: DUF1311 domain-containing protein [Variovorax sp.]|nr:DUF1311 domain-containing protein [Variovorax sp.]